MAYQASWDLVVCDGSGNAINNLIHHQGTSLTFTRNGVPECTLSLSHDDPECATILTALAQGTGGGVPTLKAYRTNRDSSKTLRFNGYLATISEESGTDASSATFTFRGPFGRYLSDGSRNPAWVTSTDTTFTATDAGQIAKSLLDTWNTVAIAGVASSAGTPAVFPVVTTGTIEASKTRDRAFPMFTNIGEAIVGLTSILDGFDFEVAPVDAGGTLGVFNVYATQGSNKPAAKFEYGPGTLANCSAIHRQTLPPLNDSNAIGNAGVNSTTFNVQSIARYSSWFNVAIYSDVSEKATLDDKANALLRPVPVKTIDFTPDPRLAPLPWDDYWIGDRVQFYANRGALVEGPLSVRVNQITVVIDPDTGLEAAEIPNPLTPDEESSIRASLQTEVVSN